MDNINQDWTPPSPDAHVRVRQILAVQAGLFILGSGLGLLAYMVLAWLMGWPLELTINEDSGWSDRMAIRTQLGLGHLFGFCVSGWLTIWLFYRRLGGHGPDWRDYLGVRQAPTGQQIGLAILLIVASIPMVLYSYQINKMIPLPEVFHFMEDQTEEALKGILKMDNLGELLLNVTIIALLPAIGEELLFRGVLQRQLMRRVSHPLVAIVLASVIFSAFHLQFEGFIPRFILGMLLGWIYWQTGNFWLPVIAHFFNNAFQVVGQYLYNHNLIAFNFEEDIEVPVLVALVSVIMVGLTMRLINHQVRFVR
ncbi:MAG: CPBP family intramembrane metalloprotease [Saprospiraceae bacterium]|nr:CPBP family intramembrane metalloprotease [Saprospiraceae bacterium]